MPKVIKIVQQTVQDFLNMFELTVEDRVGDMRSYYMASRVKAIDQLKINTRTNKADSVIVYATYKGNTDYIVLVRQYRYTVGDYVYELPAGLIEDGENYHEAAVREMWEETGLTFTPIETEACYSNPFFTTIGMTDESCRTVYGKAEGLPSNAHTEAWEDIEVVLADRIQAKEILKNHKVSLMAGYLLMNFIHSEDPFWFLK